jgi:cytochrome c oxidase subunit II
MLDHFVRSLSTYSGDVDRLILVITVLVGFWFFAAEGMFFWLILRYRRREGVPAQYVTGKEKHLKRWIDIPHALILVCDLVIVVGAIQVWVKIKQTDPTPDETVRVIGQQWAWTFDQPGPDGLLDTADDIRTSDSLHVEVGKTYRFQLESKDVLHSFFVPVFRLKQDAVPGRVITGWFKATAPGTYDISCAQICGIAHGIMAGQIVIETPAQHAAWVQAHAPVAVAAAGDATTAVAPDGATAN